MAHKDVAAIASGLAAPITERLGYELVDVEFVKEGAGWYLRIYIDKPEGVTLDDCQAVSEELGVLLDKADPIDRAYYLEVSSPGLDRPLKRDRDFEKYKGQDVDIKLYEPLNGVKDYTGRLEGLIDGKIVITDAKNKTMEFEKNIVAIVRRTIKF